MTSFGVAAQGASRGSRAAYLAGLELEEITKAAGKKDRSGYATGAGTALAGVGLVGGGAPFARPDSGRLAHRKAGTKIENTAHIVSATRGGVFGYREDAHRAFLNRQMSDKAARPKGKTTRLESFWRGVADGKDQPEKQVIRHMRRARYGANTALVGGAALAATGMHQHRRNVAKRDTHRSDAAIGGGTTLAALGAGGSLALDAQSRKWSKRSAASLDAAQKINRKLGGYDIKRKRFRVPEVEPHRSTGHNAWEQATTFAGRSSKDMKAAGKHRGAATQQRYFARVYGSSGRLARKTALAGGAIAATGLGTKYLQVRPREVSKVDVTMSDHEAKRLAARYDTRGPLPKTLSREQKMKAYEARYVATGGKKAEKWHHRAQAAEVGRNVGLVGATTSAAALLAARGKRTGPILRRTKIGRGITPHRTETAALGSALGGGYSELYGEHARSRRASYRNSPGGVAGSALSRMQAYTPTGRKK